MIVWDRTYRLRQSYRKEGSKLFLLSYIAIILFTGLFFLLPIRGDIGFLVVLLLTDPAFVLLILLGFVAIAVISYSIIDVLVFKFSFLICLKLCKETFITSCVLPPFCYFWEFWTIQLRRFGWTPPKRCHESDAIWVSDDYRNLETVTTSTMCTECYRVISQSGLIVGSPVFLTGRTEWHKWTIFFQDLQLAKSRTPCHLCNILWYSIPEAERRNFVDTNGTLPGFSNTGIDKAELYIRIWEGRTDRWYKTFPRYLQLYKTKRRPRENQALSEVFDIRIGIITHGRLSNSYAKRIR